jgi:Pyruvate/2-oxoacid:ferredoxin oxidoreductase delta subunit/nitroreductase
MGYGLWHTATPIVDPQTCTDCGRCAAICPTGTLVAQDGKVQVAEGSFMGCIACGHCMMVCPSNSIRVSGRRIAPEDLVDLPEKDRSATPDALDAMLLGRRSIRKFRHQEVDRAAVDRILQMTSTAPMGIPPTEVGIVVFHGSPKVRQFAEDAIASFRQVLRFTRPLMLALMRPMLGRAQYQMMRDFVRPLYEAILQQWDAGNDKFTYSAPLALLFHYSPRADQTDADIAATYAMLAAESLGLGSCMLGTTVALARDPAFKKKYGIPRENKTSLALVIGYPCEQFRRGIRRQMASVTFA